MLLCLDTKIIFVQFTFAREGDTEKVELVSLLSMSEEELDQNIKSLKEELSSLNKTLRKMHELQSEVGDEAQKEQVSVRA